MASNVIGEEMASSVMTTADCRGGNGFQCDDHC